MDFLAHIISIHNYANMDVDFNRQDITLLNKLRKFDYMYVTEDMETHNSYFYRCRLADIILKTPDPNWSKSELSTYRKQKAFAFHDFKRNLSRCDNWIHYEITEIDVFNRPIINIFDPLTLRCLNDIFLDPSYSLAYEIYQK